MIHLLFIYQSKIVEAGLLPDVARHLRDFDNPSGQMHAAAVLRFMGMGEQIPVSRTRVYEEKLIKLCCFFKMLNLRSNHCEPIFNVC